MNDGALRHVLTRRPQWWRLAVVALIAAAAAVVIPPPAAHAACGSVVDQASAIRQADSVFVGRVVDTADFSRLATIDVLEIWKGDDLAPRVIVNGSFSGSPQIGPNDRVFTLGATYLVVPFGSRSPFFDEACSGTALFSPLGGLIPPQFHDAVGATTGRVVNQQIASDEAPQPAGGPALWLYAGGGLLVVALVALTLRRRRRGPSKVQSAPTTPPRASNGRAPTGSAGSLDAVDNLEAMRKKTRRVKRKKKQKQQSRA